MHIHRSGRNKKNIHENIQEKRKKQKNTYLTSNQIIKQLTNNVNRMLTSAKLIIVLHETIHAKLHTPLLTISNFTQQAGLSDG